MFGIGSGSASDWKISSMLSNIDKAANDIATNMIAAIANAFHVSERVKTPKSIVSVSPIIDPTVDDYSNNPQFVSNQRLIS